MSSPETRAVQWTQWRVQCFEDETRRRFQRKIQQNRNGRQPMFGAEQRSCAKASGRSLIARRDPASYRGANGEAIMYDQPFALLDRDKATHTCQAFRYDAVCEFDRNANTGSVPGAV